MGEKDLIKYKKQPKQHLRIRIWNKVNSKRRNLKDKKQEVWVLTEIKITNIIVLMIFPFQILILHQSRETNLTAMESILKNKNKLLASIKKKTKTT